METISIVGRHGRIDIEILIALSDLSRALISLSGPFSTERRL